MQKQIAFGNQLYDLINATKDFFFTKELTSTIIKETIDNIDFDILGDAYEKFKEDDVGNSGKTTGQFFTPRCVIKHIIEDIIKPKFNEICYDSSCGTGGFIHYLSKYVNEQKISKTEKIQFINNIHGNDKNSELMKPLYINMFLHHIDIKNIKNRNSLGLTNVSDTFEKFDVIVGNPPYGGSHKFDWKEFNEFNKSKYNYWPKFMKTSGGNILDTMGQFMIHTINSLKVEGRFALVIDRGILNNGTEKESWQKKLRKFILETCDIQKIILLPKGIFTHTQFDTAIITGIKKISF
jgi:type I restriction enzyme M protein